MKKIFLVLTLLASALLFPESNKVCDIEYPPQLKYEHVYLDEYLFTSAELPQYDANDNWIDPNCFEHHLTVTEAKKSLSPNGNTELIAEPWFKQKVVWEETGFKNFALYKSMSGKKKSYGIFTANTLGNKSSHILVFQTKPTFKEITVINGYVDQDVADGIMISKDAPWSVAEKCENISMATWPQQTTLYKFNDDGYSTKIISEGKCYSD